MRNSAIMLTTGRPAANFDYKSAMPAMRKYDIRLFDCLFNYVAKNSIAIDEIGPLIGAPHAERSRR
jgi:hypothetical protein